MKARDKILRDWALRLGWGNEKSGFFEPLSFSSKRVARQFLKAVQNFGLRYALKRGSNGHVYIGYELCEKVKPKRGKAAEAKVRGE